MKVFFRRFAERKAKEATTHASAHIERENALLDVARLWDIKTKTTFRRLERAEALLLDIDDPDRITHEAAQHNKMAEITADSLPAAWLKFTVTNQATDFYVHDGRSGMQLLESAMNNAAKRILPTSQAPNPLCLRMRQIRLHLTQCGRAYHLQTSADLEPHEIELECREHMHSWERRQAEYNRIAQMAKAASDGFAAAEWKEWLRAKNPYTDPPSLAFTNDPATLIFNVPQQTDYFMLSYAPYAANDAQSLIQIDLSSEEGQQFFLGTHPTDAEAVYYMQTNPEQFMGFVSTAFEADGRVLNAAIKKSANLINISEKDMKMQALYRLVDAAAYFSSPLVAKLIVSARNEFGPESHCNVFVVSNNHEMQHVLVRQPLFDAAETMVRERLLAHHTLFDFTRLTTPKLATMLHAAGVIEQYKNRSTSYADPRGLKLAKRKLEQLTIIAVQDFLKLQDRLA